MMVIFITLFIDYKLNSSFKHTNYCKFLLQVFWAIVDKYKYFLWFEEASYQYQKLFITHFVHA